MDRRGGGSLFPTTTGEWEGQEYADAPYDILVLRIEIRGQVLVLRFEVKALLKGLPIVMTLKSGPADEFHGDCLSTSRVPERFKNSKADTRWKIQIESCVVV